MLPEKSEKNCQVFLIVTKNKWEVLFDETLSEFVICY